MTYQRAFKFMSQMCTAMIYLVSNHIVHVDLAARNCLVDRVTKQVKLSDFGLSRTSDANYAYKNVHEAIREIHPVNSPPECLDTKCIDLEVGTNKLRRVFLIDRAPHSSRKRLISGRMVCCVGRSSLAT
jgi:serine/threonine protein kinase